ncbi:MAG TPA: O-antigen ligase family protein [Gemmatimonadales bacterium]|jgi:O-antigen ligase|nr:O-antigen ligase family protein [Gemmatimonadales bacterium]
MTKIAYAFLWLFVFSLPWERFLVLPGLAIISRVTGGVAVSLALLAVVVSGQFRRWHKFHIWALLFWIWAGACFLVYHSGDRLPSKYWTYGQLLLVLWMVWELAATEARQRGLLMAYVAGAYVAALDTLAIYRQQAGAARRFAAGGADPNDMSMVLALALPMAWYLGMTSHNTAVKWLGRGFLPLGVLAIGLTGSRGGMVAATVALLIVPLSMTRLTPGRLISAMIMLLAAGALAVAYVPETTIERLSTIGTEVEGGRIGGRAKLWRAGLQAYAQHPIAGFGTGHFKSAITPILGPAAQVAHNSFVSVLVEQGIVGFTLYMAMLFAVFRSVMRLRGMDRRFALVLLVTLCVTMLPLTWEDRRVVWIVMALLLGFSQARMAWRAPAPQPVPVRAPPVRARVHGARAWQRPLAGRDDVPDVPA